MILMTAVLAAAIGWSEVDEANHLGGRKASEGYLQGKVVLVDCRDYATSKATMGRLQEVWNGFKSKPFVLLGSHRGESSADDVREAIKSVGVAYPVYAGAKATEKDPAMQGEFMYVIDATGARIYCGTDDRVATEKVVTALTEAADLRTAKAFRKHIDFEKDVLPGKAYLHLKEMNKRFPADAKAYAELWKKLKADPVVEKLARLEMFSRLAKDYDPTNKRAKFKTTPSKIGSVYKSCEELKKHENPVYAQEAKNCLADLLYAAAALKDVKIK